MVGIGSLTAYDGGQPDIDIPMWLVRRDGLSLSENAVMPILFQRHIKSELSVLVPLKHNDSWKWGAFKAADARDQRRNNTVENNNGG
jgi:hypothetical protein